MTQERRPLCVSSRLTTALLRFFPPRHCVSPNILPELYHAVVTHPPFHRNAVDGLAHCRLSAGGHLAQMAQSSSDMVGIIHRMPSDVGL
jgi:hypothetical protein